MAMTKVELKRIISDCVALEFEDIPCNEAEIEYEFSEEFLRKMDKLIEQQKKPYWKYTNTVAKRVAVVSVVCLLLFATACGYKEFREPIIQQFDKLEGIMRHYFVDGDTPMEIQNEYYLTMLPEEFELVLELGNSRWHMVAYQDENGNRIEFSQYASDGMDLIYKGCTDVEAVIEMIETMEFETKK